MIKLIISDLDGTFLNSQSEYDRELFTEVRALMHSKGVQFAACTGKQCERVEELFGDLSRDVWIVGDSATRIKYNGEFVYQSLITNALGINLIKTLERTSPESVVIACTPQGAVIRQDLAQHLKDKVRGSYRHVLQVSSFSEINDDFIKITVYDEQQRCPQIRPALDPYQEEVYIVVSEASWIDIADAGVHKGSTINKLQALLQVSRAETMAFGDGYNDIELLAEAEYSFAMRNAFDETKSVARFVTGSNDENAVLETIKRILILQP